MLDVWLGSQMLIVFVESSNLDIWMDWCLNTRLLFVFIVAMDEMWNANLPQRKLVKNLKIFMHVTAVLM